MEENDSSKGKKVYQIGKEPLRRDEESNSGGKEASKLLRCSEKIERAAQLLGGLKFDGRGEKGMGSFIGLRGPISSQGKAH